MGFYERRVFPLINDKVMADPQIEALRRETLASARGRVLEVGLGTGLNLPLYPNTIESLMGIDPNVGMHKRAQARAATLPFPVEVRTLAGESLPFESGSFDTVVCTFVMCSIRGVARALSEMRRVLKPEGHFLMLEHGLSDDTQVQVWQRRLNPLQRVVGCGCNLDRDVPSLLKAADFRIESMRAFSAPGMPKTHGFIYLGDARRAEEAAS